MARRPTPLALAVILVTAVPSGGATAQLYALLPGSEYVYLPSGFSPGIPGCEPNRYQCDFGISGSLGIDRTNGQLSFSSVDLLLTGNQSVQDDPPFPSAPVTAEALAELLLADDLLLTLVSSEDGKSIYRKSYGFSGLEATVTADQLLLSGGRDSRPVDGDGFQFDVRATLLPPTLLGDANNDNQVTGADLVSVQHHFGRTGPGDGTLPGDANDDGRVTGADLITVHQNFGNARTALVPEPAVALLLLGAWMRRRVR